MLFDCVSFCKPCYQIIRHRISGKKTVECFEGILRCEPDADNGVLYVFEIPDEGNPLTIGQALQKRLVAKVRCVDVFRGLRLFREEQQVLVIHLFQFSFEAVLNVEIPSVGVIEDVLQLRTHLDEKRLRARLAAAVHFFFLLRLDALLIVNENRIHREGTDLYQVPDLIRGCNVALWKRYLRFLVAHIFIRAKVSFAQAQAQAESMALSSRLSKGIKAR